MSPRVDQGDWKVLTCWGTAGDDVSLQVPCVKSYVDAGLPVPPRPVAPGTPGRRRPREGAHDAALWLLQEHERWSIISRQ